MVEEVGGGVGDRAGEAQVGGRFAQAAELEPSCLGLNVSPSLICVTLGELSNLSVRPLPHL